MFRISDRPNRAQTLAHRAHFGSKLFSRKMIKEKDKTVDNTSMTLPGSSWIGKLIRGLTSSIILKWLIVCIPKAFGYTLLLVVVFSLHITGK